jgi:hypothetical protein
MSPLLYQLSYTATVWYVLRKLGVVIADKLFKK